MAFIRFFCLLIFAYGLLLPDPARAAASGDLDTLFGANGKTNFSVGPTSDEGRDSMAVQEDGKIVVLGSCYTGSGGGSTLLARFDATGNIDRSFAGDGSVLFEFTSSSLPRLLALQNDGKVLVAGTTPQGANTRGIITRYHSNGSLDTTFGANGVATVGAEDNEQFSAMAVQADGKIVLSGTAYYAFPTKSRFLVVRFNSNGTRDTSFGTSGEVVTTFNRDGVAQGLALQGDGRIIVSGHFSDPGGISDVALVRYNSDGTPDATFGTAGIVASNFQAMEQARSVKVQADGRIVICGIVAPNGGKWSTLVARYLGNGTLDATFGTGGRTFTQVNSDHTLISKLVLAADGDIVAAGQTAGSTNRPLVLRYSPTGVLDNDFANHGIKVAESFFSQDLWYDVALQSDGKIVLLGENNDIIMGRYLANGTLDTTFGNIGRSVTDILRTYDDFGRAIARMPDGKILVAGYSHNGLDHDISLTRYAQGRTDQTYGEGGRRMVFNPAGDDHAYGLVIQDDGKALVVGDQSNGTNSSFTILRFTIDGGTDITFGTSGRRVVDFGAGDDSARAIALRDDGKVVIAGYADGDFAIAVCGGNGALDTTFGSGGKMTTQVGTGASSAMGVVAQPDGKMILAGFASNSSNTDFALVRYETDGTLDTGFGTNGKVLTPVGSGADVANSIALQADGKIIVAGYARTSGSDNVALVRYLPNGALDSTFGTGGKVVTVVSGDEDIAYYVKVQEDGRILVSGTTRQNGTNDMLVLRYLPNGTLDNTWGGAGKVVTDIGSGTQDYGYSLLTFGDRIVVGGSATGAYKTNNAMAAYINLLPPAVAVQPAEPVFGTAATLRGSINPNAAASTAAFEYGLTTSYGSSVPLTLSPADGNTLQQVSAGISGLTPNTLYYYRLTGSNANGESRSGSQTFTTTAASTNANLSSLMPSSGVLVPGFSPENTEYSLGLGDFVTSLQITPAAAHGNAAITVQNVPVVSGSSSAAVPVPAGASSITTVVAAEDGVTTKSYLIQVTRPASSSSGLSGLTLSTGTLSPAFAAGTLEYDASVPTQTASVMVTATAHAYATVVINNTSASGGTASVPLNYGSNSIAIHITSENDLTASEYSIDVFRAFPAPEIVILEEASIPRADGATVTFGSVGTGGTKSKSLSILNTGTADLTGISVSLDGPNANLFELVAQPAAEVTPGSSTSFQIRYSPPAVGNHTATVHISSNDADEASYEIVLTATAVKSAPVFVVKTLAATGISVQAATLNASVTANNGRPNIFFDYGPTTSLGTTVVATPAQVTATGTVNVSAALSGLQPHTRCYYRVRGSGASGTAAGATLNFTTQNRPPTLTTDAFTVSPGAVVVLNVRENDSDPDGDSLTISANTAIPAAQGKLARTNTHFVFTAAAGFSGVTFQYTVKDGFGGVASSSVTLNLGTSSIDPVAKNLLAAGETYPVNVTATGAWSVNESVPWLSAAGSQSGSGTAQITVQPNAGKNPRTATILIAGKQHTITQAGVEVPDIAVPSLIPPAIVSGSYSLAIPTTNPPVTYTVANLPAGLTINQATGVISGKPTKHGDPRVTVKARNAAGSAPTVVEFDLHVDPLPQEVVGTYHGLISRDAGVNGLLGSRFEMTTAATGVVSGKVITGATSRAFKGALDADVEHPDLPSFTASIPQGGGSLALNLTLDGTSDTLTGTASLVPLTAWRQVWRASGPMASVYKGLHTFFLTPPTSDDTLPQGHGFGSFTVDEKTGGLKVVGKLADNSSLLSSSFLGPQGQVLIYQPLYSNKGSFSGILAVAVDREISGSSVWYKPSPAANSRDTIYRNGFGPITFTAAGGAFPALPQGGVVMGLPNAESNAALNFTLGGLEDEGKEFQIIFDLLNPKATGLTNKAFFPSDNPNKVTLPTVNTATGALAGDFTIPGATAAKNRKVSYFGQLVKTAGVTRGYGFFLLPQPPSPPQTLATSPKQSGRVILSPAVP